jgi:hypothetical protein
MGCVTQKRGHPEKMDNREKARESYRCLLNGKEAEKYTELTTYRSF